MRSPGALSLLVSILLGPGGSLDLPATCNARYGTVEEVGGSLVTVSVEVDGSPAVLYPAPDGSGRCYLEARRGAEYDVSVFNRTSGRLGVALVVDGLDAITGERRDVGSVGSADGGRMYVLEPWGMTTVRGWRTSLNDVRRFTFVDEEASYAARSGKANSKMGWIEVLVYREREPRPLLLGQVAPAPRPRAEAPSRSRQAPSRGPAAPEGAARQPSEAPAAGAYPGTGWGAPARDRVVVVEFEPERRAAERVTLRYEYRDGLVALGVIRPVDEARGRLAEREWGGEGFAQSPPP